MEAWEIEIPIKTSKDIPSEEKMKPQVNREMPIAQSPQQPKIIKPPPPVVVDSRRKILKTQFSELLISKHSLQSQLRPLDSKTEEPSLLAIVPCID